MKKMKKSKDNISRIRDMEIIGAYTYNKGSLLSIHIYDRKLKRVFAGVIFISSWTREEVLSDRTEDK